jgi:hypothetical protein
MTDLSLYNNSGSNDQSPFDSIRRYDEHGKEYWCARELMKLLGYTNWRRFGSAESEKGRNSVVKKAVAACKNSGSSVDEHFTHLTSRASGSGTMPEDWQLTRYACYLIAQNGDPDKEEIAAAQSYFATKTRQAEIAESAHEPIVKALPTRDAFEYIQAADTLAKLPDSRLTRLLSQMLVSEVALVGANQRQIAPTVEEVKQYTTATVRASQLGYSAAQVGNGSGLGKFVKTEIAPDFADWQGQYMVNHFEVCDHLDSRIHAYFLTRAL